ncbi:hypothetical protein K1719_028366 [Acacia pycnantha]|nr:hypothetical protein K1719_028366 [Acacia pycnantha]
MNSFPVSKFLIKKKAPNPQLDFTDVIFEPCHCGGRLSLPFTMAVTQDSSWRTGKSSYFEGIGCTGVNYQPLCIQYPDLAANFELKSDLIHFLPKFHGLAGECPIKHLKEFHIVCGHNEATCH